MLACVQIPHLDPARGKANDQLLSDARLLVRALPVRYTGRVLNSYPARPAVRTFCSLATPQVLLVVRSVS